ncbi:MAG TPA: hypothetical protein VFF02_17305 [Anaeromyxobacteraceae bacterium]|nr:hypothetical protein [Anaeromyxobacteraceae bacterium]
MKKLWEKIGTLMAAAAFAEEGEVETAREMLAETDADAPGDEQKPMRRPPRLVPTHAKASRA